MEFTQTYIDALLEQAIIFVPKLLLAMVIFLLTLYLAKVVANLTQQTLVKRKVDPELTLLMVRFSRWGIIIYGTIIALQQVDFQVTSFIAGLGVVGFAFTFAFQDIAENFISGVLILLQQPFNIGEAIEVDDLGGTVEDINIRSTILRTWDGKEVVVPNATIYKNKIINYSNSPKRRFELNIGVAYNSNLDEVTRILMAVLQQIEGIIQDDSKAPVIVFNDFGDSAINLKIYYWVDTTILGIWAAQDKVLKSVKTGLDEASIEIPYPVRTLQVNQTDKNGRMLSKVSFEN